MTEELKEVLERCSETASWFGMELKGLNSVNSMGDTPLHTVCSWGELSSARTLIENGANVNAKGDNGASPLFNAVIGGNSKVVSLLVESGCNARNKNNDGRSVLQYAKNINAPRAIIEVLE